MASKFTLLILFILFFLLSDFFIPSDQSPTNSKQTEFFAVLKKSLSGDALSDWNLTKKPVCNFSGVACDDRGLVVGLDLSGWSLSGHFPPDVCKYIPALRVLRLGGSNNFLDEFPHGVTNCSVLEELNLSFLYLQGTLPDFSAMNSLRILDLSYNAFRGNFPISVTNLTNLEILNFNENGNFNLWKLPENISGLTKLKTMVLTTCMVYGPIPRSIGNMTSLVDLELSGNFLVGRIPAQLGLLKNVRQLELYYNQLFGEIPGELGNMTALVDVDMSVNQLKGTIPETICRLPNLKVLQLYNNSLSGEIPAAIEESTTLTMLSLYDNFLTGQVPRNLGRLSPMLVLDLSENNLSGPLPTDICRGGRLLYFLILDNSFSGELPQSYGECQSLLRFRVSNNRLEGSIPKGLLGLPHVSILDLANNNFSGPIGDSIANARNLSELFIQSNKISGVLPSGISRATKLVKIDLSKNLISGPIPSEIGNLKRLNLLLLQGNKLSSSIPDSLSLIKSLNVLDLSNNLLTGNIPESLCELLPNSINFSNNMLAGPIPLSLIKGGLVESFSGNPNLCVSTEVKSSHKAISNFPLCSKPYNRKKLNSIWAISISLMIFIVGAVLFLKRRFGKEKKVIEHDETFSPNSSYEMKSFHRISFDQREIMEAMVEKNIIGHGASGTVYKIELKTNEVVAVKRLWSKKLEKNYSPSDYDDQLILHKTLKTEVEILGCIRHKNIVKLFCYFSSLDCNLLVYEYMPNGNLWDALHKGWVSLDWPTRHQIALGIAQGLAYLHHDLPRPIIHRDIKSTNILLDVNYQPKVADFGIAKVLQCIGAQDSATTTVVAGTYGYLAPEYAYTSKATTKCDVYSFGVVLMELITGRNTVEDEFGDNKNIIHWVSKKVDTREGAIEVLDKRVPGSFKDEMVWVLRVAIRCTYKNPVLRPTMKEVVRLLIDADPCKPFNSSSKSSQKINDNINDNITMNKDTSKIKDHFELV